MDTSLVKRLTRLRKYKKDREEQQRVVICGAKLIQDLQLPILHLLLPPDAPGPEDAIRVSPEILTRISGRADAVAEVALPPQAPLGEFKRLLILDGVSDPGNMGTLLRTALAFGWDELLLLPGCADPFNDKALRASQGAIFSLRYRWDTQIPPCTLYVAHTSGTLPQEAPTPLALALGSEGRGPSPQTLAQGSPISIPIATESLNVAIAGGILMCRFRL